MLNIQLKGCEPFVSESIKKKYITKAYSAMDLLDSGKGAGGNMLGWHHLPSEIPSSFYDKCETIKKRWEAKGINSIIIVGIGGSYLGTKAALTSLSKTFPDHRTFPRITFAGTNFSEDFYSDLYDLMTLKNVAVIVISKSGTTAEPAVAFRLIKKFMEDKYGKAEARERIVTVTDKDKGALRNITNKEGYDSFAVPSNVGGRYSVLSPVSLFPLYLVGFDIKAMIEGAKEMEHACSKKSSHNPAVVYAAMRNVLHGFGKKEEILVNFNPKLRYIAEWWKQLFAESEGKDGKGIFPAFVNYTTDLHAIGQYIQEGQRTMFETYIEIAKPSNDVVIPYDADDMDGLNYLAGKTMSECNRLAMLGTIMAHIDGEVPQIGIEIDELNEYEIGALFYFFEKACAISSYMLGVNPFNQPGVEAYKKNMFALFGRPGYEDIAESLKARL
ncbi:MAG: glucose-6-phosphate isomerase [Bacteroidales bacterium]|nr:glucose-6-phosphate isomerase [Bacteroidales bacterium]